MTALAEVLVPEAKGTEAALLLGDILGTHTRGYRSRGFTPGFDGPCITFTVPYALGVDLCRYLRHHLQSDTWLYLGGGQSIPFPAKGP